MQKTLKQMLGYELWGQCKGEHVYVSSDVGCNKCEAMNYGGNAKTKMFM